MKYFCFPSDAAGLIRHMLTVTPSRRATMEDALRHWWVNFGHAHMPNDVPYSPDDEPPVMPYTLSVSDDPFPETLPVIHQRNQSSLSSDSDVELDFRPARWSSRKRLPLDSTGGSLSSSVGGSPAPTPDSGSLGDDLDDEDPAAIASSLLKLPPDVLDILKGCRSKSLAALLNQGKVSSGFDSPENPGNNVNGGSCSPCSPQYTADVSKPLSFDNEKISPSSSVFDSERKPARSILKRKGKFSGGDSGCQVNEDSSPVTVEETPLPKSGHLPRRMPSFKDEANGIFAGRHRARHLLDNSNGHVRDSWGCTISQTPACNSQSPSSHEDPLQTLPATTISTTNSNNSPLLHDSYINHCQQQQQLPDYQNFDALQHHHEPLQQPPPPPPPVPQHHYTPYNFQQTKEQHQHTQNHNQNQCLQYQHNVNNSKNLNGHISTNVSNANHKEPPHPPVMDSYNHKEPPHPPVIDSYNQGHQSSDLSTSHSKSLSKSHCLNLSSSTDALDRTTDIHPASLLTPSTQPPSTQPQPSSLSVNQRDPSSQHPAPKIIHVKQLSDSQTSKIVWRPKSILKNYKPSQMDEARNRLSISSIGSNSSADILDLSYDSGDSDHFINMAFELGSEFSIEPHGPGGQLNPMVTVPRNDKPKDPRRQGKVWTDDQQDVIESWSHDHPLCAKDWSSAKSLSCDHSPVPSDWPGSGGINNGSNNSPCSDLHRQFEGMSVSAHDVANEEGRELLDQTSILYRLTREAKGLL